MRGDPGHHDESRTACGGDPRAPAVAPDAAAGRCRERAGARAHRGERRLGEPAAELRRRRRELPLGAAVARRSYCRRPRASACRGDSSAPFADSVLFLFQCAERHPHPVARLPDCAKPREAGSSGAAASSVRISTPSSCWRSLRSRAFRRRCCSASLHSSSPPRSTPGSVRRSTKRSTQPRGGGRVLRARLATLF